MQPANEVDLELDINRELDLHKEISGGQKQLTEFDATLPMYVTSLGRGKWPKPNPNDIRLPRAFYESKGLLSSRAQPVSNLADKKKSLGRGRILSNYSSSRQGQAPSSMTGGLTMTSQDDLVPVDLEEGKAALMRKFLGTPSMPVGKSDLSNKPGHGSLVFSGCGSVKTLPDIKCKEQWPSLFDDDVHMPVKISHSDVGMYREPTQKPSETDGNTYQSKPLDIRPPPEKPSVSGEEDEGMKTPASGDSFSFKDLAKEIKNSTASYTHTSDVKSTLTGESKVAKRPRGRGRGRKLKRSDEDFLGAGEMTEGDDTLTSVFEQTCSLSGPSVLQIECLPMDITEEEVVDLLSLWGKVTECRLLKDTDTNDCIGIAQIRMSSERECCMAISVLHQEETPFPGRYPDDALPNLVVSILQ